MNMFVYGTLKKGHSNHKLLKRSTYIGEATIEGYCIYDLGFYPGIKVEEGSQVAGELYEITDQVLKDLDRLEGEGYLYKREMTEARLMNGERIETAVYVYNQSVKGKRKLSKTWRGRETDD